MKILTEDSEPLDEGSDPISPRGNNRYGGSRQLHKSSASAPSGKLTPDSVKGQKHNARLTLSLMRSYKKPNLPESIDFDAFLDHIIENYPGLVEEFINKD